MKRERVEYRKPYGRGDYELLRGGEGVYWQAGNGLEVRIAAADHATEERQKTGIACFGKLSWIRRGERFGPDVCITRIGPDTGSTVIGGTAVIHRI